MLKNRILVTGIAGFLGSNLLPALIESGYTVVGVDDLSQGKLDRIQRYIGEHFKFFEADVRDIHKMQKIGQDVDCIIHLAEIKIPRYGTTLDTLEVNVRGTENMLDIAVTNKARFILGSTDEVYGKNPESRLNEESALIMGETNVNRWSLGVSKLMAEQLCFAYREKFEVPITILRYFGGYGPNQPLDWQGGAQSVFINAAIKCETIPIHGDGLQTRTFTHVKDLVSGTLLALESPYAEGEILNIASNDALNIINLAYLIWRLSGNQEKHKLEFIPYTDFSRNYEDVRSRIADISKAHYLIGYEPKVKITEGLNETVQWQKGLL